MKKIIGKNFTAILDVYLLIETRFLRNFFQDIVNQEIFKDETQEFCQKNKIEIEDYWFNKSQIILHIYFPPTISVTSIAFNLRRLSSRKLIQQNIKELRGEHAFWSKQYYVARNLDELKEIRSEPGNAI